MLRWTLWCCWSVGRLWRKNESVRITSITRYVPQIVRFQSHRSNGHSESVCDYLLLLFFVCFVIAVPKTICVQNKAERIALLCIVCLMIYEIYANVTDQRSTKLRTEHGSNKFIVLLKSQTDCVRMQPTGDEKNERGNRWKSVCGTRIQTCLYKLIRLLSQQLTGISLALFFDYFECHVVAIAFSHAHFGSDSVTLLSFCGNCEICLRRNYFALQKLANYLNRTVYQSDSENAWRHSDCFIYLFSLETASFLSKVGVAGSLISIFDPMVVLSRAF